MSHYKVLFGFSIPWLWGSSLQPEEEAGDPQGPSSLASFISEPLPKANKQRKKSHRNRVRLRTQGAGGIRSCGQANQNTLQGRDKVYEKETDTITEKNFNMKPFRPGCQTTGRLQNIPGWPWEKGRHRTGPWFSSFVSRCPGVDPFRVRVCGKLTGHSTRPRGAESRGTSALWGKGLQGERLQINKPGISHPSKHSSQLRSVTRWNTQCPVFQF